MAEVFDSMRFPSAEDGVQIYKMYIDGEWVEASNRATFEVRNPFDNSLLARVQKATINDAERAVSSAIANKGKMAHMDAVDRAKLLEKVGNLIYQYFDYFVSIIVADGGKPVSVARGEVEATAERFKFAAEEAKEIMGESLLGDNVPWHRRKVGMVLRQPLGVVLAISPFNYPLFIASAKIAPALAAGNAVVAKPASDDPIAVLFLARIIEMAGFPRGVFNVITGGGGDIGDYLAKHENIDMNSFTGSSEVGEHIANIAGMKKLHLELGGKSPALVLEDADLDVATKQCVSGALKYSGQRCDAISRILVVDSVADKFIKKVLKEVENWKVGDPREESVQIGPIINERAVQKIDELVQDAVAKGAKLLAGGNRLQGQYYPPTVLDKVTPNMRIAWEETFGPVVTIIRVKDYEEAIRIANESVYGLDASVFTESVDKALDAALRLEDGTVNINAAPAHGVGNFPFGGDKESGMDREGIKFSVEDMTKLHTIIFNPK
ncbi:MAG: aldehyde dehydrogenase family protein [Candidatus Altiarchaeota archaeon]|nr:aldehyde dehydrogenase family protein [Candidatus Altiarchaeota archaeon]